MDCSLLSGISLCEENRDPFQYKDSLICTVIGIPIMIRRLWWSNGCIISIVAAAALLPKHQTTSINSSEQISIALSFVVRYHICSEQYDKLKLLFEKKPSGLWVNMVNSSPSGAYMRQWIGLALVEIMACCLFGHKPLCWVIVNGTHRNKLQWNLNRNTNIFIHENAFENNVCKMADNLSRGRWVDTQSKKHLEIIPKTDVANSGFL